MRHPPNRSLGKVAPGGRAVVRAVPFYCPYCAEQSIEPAGDGPDYYCESCDRRFEVTFKGFGEAATAPAVSSSS
ncbi:MAG: hypothetical protein GEU68_07730 [Actinobacteria bacterium]|jgi:transposase-like protein|nr:hypothetical protein [Actinomycetota bacterium]